MRPASWRLSEVSKQQTANSKQQTDRPTVIQADILQPRFTMRLKFAVCCLRSAVYCLLGERKRFDDAGLVIYYARQHWKGGDSKYMNSYHSEVAAA